MCQRTGKTQRYNISDIGNENPAAKKKKFLSSKTLHSTEKDKLYNKESISMSIFIFAYMFTRCQVQSKEKTEEGGRVGCSEEASF